MSKIVNVSVNDSNFSLFKRTLEKFPDCVLTKFVGSGETECDFICCEDGRYYLDLDSESFGNIVKFMKGYPCYPEDWTADIADMVYRDCGNLCLTELKEKVEPFITINRKQYTREDIEKWMTHIDMAVPLIQMITKKYPNLQFLEKLPIYLKRFFLDEANREEIDKAIKSFNRSKPMGAQGKLIVSLLIFGISQFGSEYMMSQMMKKTAPVRSTVPINDDAISEESVSPDMPSSPVGEKVMFTEEHEKELREKMNKISPGIMSDLAASISTDIKEDKHKNAMSEGISEDMINQALNQVMNIPPEELEKFAAQMMNSMGCPK